MEIQNKTIVVTGAGSGIGRELCLQLLHKKAKVIGVDIHSTTLAETQNLSGVSNDRFMGFVMDITDRAKVEEFANAVEKEFGAIDGIINNAGIIQKFVPVNEMNMEDIIRVMNVNFYGTVFLTKALLPGLLKRPEAHIVNMSSMGGFMSFPKQTIYGASKAAIKIFTEGLYAELKDTNVHVTVVHPGAIATNINENSGNEKFEVAVKENKKGASNMALSPTKAAELIIQAIEKNMFRVMVGKDAKMMDILYRVSPRFATNFIGKMMKKAGI